MNKEIEEKAEETTNKLLAERKARRARFDELKCKIEENEGALERKRNALNDMMVRYHHGMIDLTFFAGSQFLRDRADAERNALHKHVDDMAALRKDYDRGTEENNKLIDESNKLCKQIEEDEAPLGGFVGGLLGGAAAQLFGSALTKAAAKVSPDAFDPPATEPPPPPGSGAGGAVTDKGIVP
jgi:hypothetical protein